MSTELGDILVKAGKVSQEQVDEALTRVKDRNEKFEVALVTIGAVDSEDEISRFVGKHLKIENLKYNITPLVMSTHLGTHLDAP